MMSASPTIESPPWRPSSRLAGAVILLVVIAALLYALRSLLLPLLLALLLAYMLAPVMHWLRRKLKLPRLVSAVLIFAILGAVLGGVATGLGLAANQQLGGLIEDLILLSDQVPDQLARIAEAKIVIGQNVPFVTGS